LEKFLTIKKGSRATITLTVTLLITLLLVSSMFAISATGVTAYNSVKLNKLSEPVQQAINEGGSLNVIIKTKTHDYEELIQEINRLGGNDLP